MSSRASHLIPVALLASILVGISQLGCRHDSNVIDEFPPVCFDTEVLPIFQTSCAYSGCHNASTAEAGVILDSYSNILSHVKPYDSRNSSAYQAITSVWEAPMPPDRPLTKEQRTIIRVWIDQGAMEIKCDTTGQNIPPVVEACFSRDVLPVMLSSCAISGCHDATTAAEGVRLYSYTTVMQSGVTAYQPASSRVYNALSKAAGSEDIMPPSPYQLLPQAAIDSIYRWILLGAKNETCVTACDTVSTITYTLHISPIVQSNCLGCHSGGSPSGGVPLSTYADVVYAVNNNHLIQSVNRTGTFPMPPSSSLSTCEIRQFELWAQTGTTQK